MKIYDLEGFPNPARIRIALAEKNALDQVEFIAVDVMGASTAQTHSKPKTRTQQCPMSNSQMARAFLSAQLLQNILTALFRGSL